MVVTGTSTSAVAQIQTFTAMLGDARSCRNVTRGVEHQLRTITTSKPQGKALSDRLAISSPSAPVCLHGPFSPEPHRGPPFPSPWQCTHPAVVTPATQERPPGRVTTCSHGPALRRSSRTNMAPPRPPHSPTSPLLCLGHCGPRPSRQDSLSPPEHSAQALPTAAPQTDCPPPYCVP